MSKKVNVRVGERWYEVEVGDLDSDPISTDVDGVRVEVSLGDLAGATGVPQLSTPVAQASIRPPHARREFYSPASGVVASVSVCEGDQVVTGDEVCAIEVMEGMKALRADWSGLIKRVCVEPGQEVSAGELIAELE